MNTIVGTVAPVKAEIRTPEIRTAESPVCRDIDRRCSVWPSIRLSAEVDPA